MTTVPAGGKPPEPTIANLNAQYADLIFTLSNDLQPVAPQPTKSNQTMMHKLPSLALALTCGLASSIPNSLNGYVLGSSPSGRFICNTNGKPSGYSHTRKQNPRNSQRKGKQYKQRKAA